MQNSKPNAPQINNSGSANKSSVFQRTKKVQEQPLASPTSVTPTETVVHRTSSTEHSLPQSQTEEVPYSQSQTEEVPYSQSQTEEVSISKSFYSSRERQVRYLEQKFGSKALNEITLLESGNSTVSNCNFYFFENKQTKKQDLFLSLDYEVSTVKGPICDLCSKDKIAIAPLQFQRATYIFQGNNRLKLQNREIVLQNHAVVAPSYQPYASMSYSLSLNSSASKSLNYLSSITSIFCVLGLCILFFIYNKLIVKSKMKFPSET